MATSTYEVRITGDAKDLERTLGKVDRSLAGSTKSWAKFAAKGAAVAGAGLALRKVVTATVDFDRAMRNVNSIAQLNEKQFRKLEDSVLSLVGPTNQAPKVLAEGLYDLVSSGFDAKESLDVLEASAKAATAGLTTTEVSTKAVAAVLNAYKLPAKRAGAVSDALFRTVDRGVVSFEELSSTIGDVLPFASSLDVDLQEVGASVATMTKAGISAPETMTRIKNVMVSLLKPSEGLKGAFKELGVESGEQLIKQRGFQGALEALVGTTDGTKKAVADLFPNIRAMGGALALTGKNAKGARDDLAGMRESSGATEKALKQQSKSIGYWWDWLGHKADELAIRVGTFVQRMVEDIRKGRGDVAKAIKDIAHALGPVLRDAIKSAELFFRGFMQTVRGIAKLISGILTGDFGKAWDGVKDIFSGGVKAALGLLRGFTTPVRNLAKKAGELLMSGLGSAWDWVVGKFNDGKAAILGVVNGVIDILNKIPGVDIGKVGGASGVEQRDRSSSRKGNQVSESARGRARAYQRGGFIPFGDVGRDSVPALLERDEYVLNKKAVRAVGGPAVLDRINFGLAPRFALGGAIGSLASKGAGYLIDKLPKPSIPQPFTGVGPWLIDQVTGWIKGKTKKAGNVGLGSMPASLQAAMALAQQMGLTITSTTGGGHTPTSWHYKGRAFDASNGSSPTPQMRAFALAVARRWGSSALEMFYDPLGWYIKNGAKVSGSIGGHSDHVHVAMQKGGVVGTMARVLSNHGLDKEAIAGIIGNAYGESNWNPGAMEPGTNNGGLFGFTAGEKSLTALKAFAERQGKPWTSAKVQTQFMLTTFPASMRSAINALDSIEATTEYFMSEWERPGIPRLDARISGAKKAYGMLGNLGSASRGKKGGGAPSKAGIAKAQIAQLPGLPFGKVPKALSGLSSSITGLFTGPGMNREQRFGASELGLGIAAETADTGDDRALYQWQRGVSQARKQAIRKQLSAINRRLAKPMSPKQRNKLLTRRDALTSELSTVQGRITSAREGLAGLDESSGSEADERGREALEANTRAIEAHTQELGDVKKSIDEQNRMAAEGKRINQDTALGALTDRIMGRAGATMNQHVSLAGTGGPGSSGRF